MILKTVIYVYFKVKLNLILLQSALCKSVRKCT